MATNEEFIAWALGPERTLEEAYGAERIVELGDRQWSVANGQPQPSYEQRAKFAKKRRQNPAQSKRAIPVGGGRTSEKLSAITCTARSPSVINACLIVVTLRAPNSGVLAIRNRAAANSTASMIWP